MHTNLRERILLFKYLDVIHQLSHSSLSLQIFSHEHKKVFENETQSVFIHWFHAQHFVDWLQFIELYEIIVLVFYSIHFAVSGLFLMVCALPIRVFIQSSKVPASICQYQRLERIRISNRNVLRPLIRNRLSLGMKSFIDGRAGTNLNA